ncbi:MAG: TatD family hydrolase [Candidatus Nitrosopumilus sp. bin_6a]
MNFVDPHIHMYSRTTDDYEKMALAGIRTVIEPSFWLGQERTSPDTLVDYWEYIITFEKNRASQFGIDHYCAISINPKEANNKKFAEKSLLLIEDYLQRENVVALGEIGFDLISIQEEEIFRKQLLLADKLKIPVIIHTPHINKLEGTKKTFEIIEETQVEQSRIIVDHNNEDTIELSLSYDVHSGITVYPNTKLSPFRAVNILKKFGTNRILINSSADWGISDPLSVPKMALEMESHGFSENEITKVLFDNPNSFFKQSKNYNPLK